MIVLGALKSIIVLHLSFLFVVCCLVVVVVVGTCWDFTCWGDSVGYVMYVSM